MTKRTALALIMAMTASVAVAHSGVQNAAVKARMDMMGDIKEATGVLGGMAKGSLPFDAVQADTARSVLEDHAAKIPGMFEDKADDPKSEALPTIWTDWEGFVADAEQMEAAARTMDTSSLDSVRAGLGAIGKSCSACHKAYRIEK